MKILYVEDDPTAREYIRKGLSEHGHVVDTAADGEQGLMRAETGEHDLVVLDVGLPITDGFEVLESLRRGGVGTPVIMLSARSDVSDRVKGLQLGADDYLPKPFAFAELIARIDAIGRRLAPHVPDDGVLRVADLALDTRRHAVTRAGRPVELTRREFVLLEYLMRNSGHVLSRTMITERVWDHAFDSYSNVIDVHIAHLRKKIDREAARKLIHTVKGIGYILEDRPPAARA